MGLTCSKSSSCTSIIAIDGRKHGTTENNRSDSLDPFMYDVMRKSLSMTLLENANQAAATTSTTTSQEAAPLTTIDNHNVNHSDMNSKNQGKFNYMDSGTFPSPYVGQHHLLYKNQKLENIVQIQSQSATNPSEITGAQTESKPQTQTQSNLVLNAASTKTATGVDADTLTDTTDANTTGTTNTIENPNVAASYRPPTTTAISESTVTIGDIKSSVSPPWTTSGIGMQQNKQHNRMQMLEDPYHHRMYNSTSPTVGQTPPGSTVCPTTPSAGIVTSCSSSSAKTTLIPDAEWSYKYPTKLVVRRRSINYHHQQQHHDTDCSSNPAGTGTSNCSSTTGTHIYAVRYPAQVFDSDENDLDGISINHPALVSQEQCPTSLMSKSKKQYHKQRQQHQQSAAAGPASCNATTTTATGHHTNVVSSITATATSANIDSKKQEIIDHHHYQQQQQLQPSSLPSPLSEPQDYFQPSYMLKNRPQQLITDWVTVSEEHNIYIVDVGLTPLQCDRIVQVTELACRGQYAAYTYAKQTLGCREFPFLAQVCAPPIHSMVHSILAFSDQRNNEKNNSNKNSGSTNKNNNSRESQQQQQLYGQQPPSTTTTTSKHNNNGSNNTSSNNANSTTATSYNLQLDDREPHLVKYDVTKKERQKLDMHTDKSEWTFLIALSNGCGLDYDGGGTYFECLNATIHVSRGHALVFPGKLRHCGQRITRGLRYLLVGFLVNKQNTQSAVTAAAAAQQTNSSSNTNASSSSISTNNKNNNNNVKNSCSSPTSGSNDNQDSSSGAVDDHVYHQRTF